MKVAIVHPDLGLGGAERLITDIALALQALKHHVTIYTSYLDPHRCFPEVHPSKATVPVEVVASAIPRSICGRFHAFLAAARCTYAAAYIALCDTADLVICDVVAMPMIALYLRRKPGIFYCHFPDKELFKTLNCDNGGILQRIYRKAFNTLDEIGLRCASKVVCNSMYTRKTFVNTFPHLDTPSVVYPCVAHPTSMTLETDQQNLIDTPFFLSINRFERKKNIDLALQAFAHFSQGNRHHSASLVIAGGYDDRLNENKAYYRDLQRLARDLGIQKSTHFMQNLSDVQKDWLLGKAIAVLYTPKNEHFGIVPLEAMVRGTPVLATNTGGPTEVIQDGETGFLRGAAPIKFAEAMSLLVTDEERRIKMGLAAKQHALKSFSMISLMRNLQSQIDLVVSQPQQNPSFVR